MITYKEWLNENIPSHHPTPIGKKIVRGALYTIPAAIAAKTIHKHSDNISHGIGYAAGRAKVHLSNVGDHISHHLANTKSHIAGVLG